jgi:hypothetical protein
MVRPITQYLDRPYSHGLHLFRTYLAPIPHFFTFVATANCVAMTATTKPSELLDNLDAEEIEARLSEIHREARALRVLLRAARARGQVSKKRPAKPKEVTNAS